MSKNIVFEGWLTKSPPSKRIWRTKWRRRWFALRQSGELPGQYFLDYYADRNCRRPKGTINLDLCEQVDAGLHMERTGNGSLDPKLRGSVFTIQTQSRTYHLEADCEAEMTKWVDAICRVCGLRATDDEPANEMETYRISVNDQHYETAESTGPYIPISECITGVRAQDRQQAFTFDTKNIVISAPQDRGSANRGRQIYTSQSQIRQNNVEFSENESNVSDDDCKSLHASQPNIPEVIKSFTKLTIHAEQNGDSEEGPPVPPRPPKTFAKYKDVPQGTFHITEFREPVGIHDNISIAGETVTWLRVPRHPSYGGVTPPLGQSLYTPASIRNSEDNDEFTQGHLSMQYCNLPSLPPAVDRALKPRHSSNITHIHHLMGTGMHMYHDEIKAAHVLQYLDLDLPTSAPEPSTSQDGPRKMDIIHGKSTSSIEEESAYKTVDFVKTEAFNITRQDAEASRSHLP